MLKEQKLLPVLRALFGEVTASFFGATTATAGNAASSIVAAA